MNRILQLGLAGVILAVSGCTTTMKGEKFTGTQEGIRYSLPVPFLSVTPQPDGTIKVDVIYLPDPNNEYVIQTQSFLSSYTLNINTTDGMLKSVQFEPDTTQVAAKVAETTGNVAKARIEAKDQAEAKRAEDLKSARKAIADAQEDLNAAEAKLGVLKSKPPSQVADKMLQAEIDVAAAKAKLDTLKGEVASMGASEFNIPQGSLNAPEGGATVSGFPNAWGPALYRFHYDPKKGKNGWSLIPVSTKEKKQIGQLLFETSTLAQGAVKFELHLEKDIPVTKTPQGILNFNVKANEEIDRVMVEQVALASKDNPMKTLNELKPTAVELVDSKTLRVTLNVGTPPGKYWLHITVTLKKRPEEPQTHSVEFEVKQ